MSFDLATARGNSERHQAPSLDGLCAAYAGGDSDVIKRALTDPADFAAAVADIDAVTGRWRADWRPIRATFLLDLARAANDAHASQAMLRTVVAGGTFVMRRPAVADPTMDRYEVLWHHAAIALLDRSGSSWTSQYLQSLRKRFSSATFTEQFALSDAIARAESCCGSSLLSGIEPVNGPPLARTGTGAADASGVALSSEPPPVDPDRSLDTKVNDAIHQFDLARQVPASRAEASVRGALLWLIRGKSDRALAWLDDVVIDGHDRDLEYWAALTRGRACDALKRSGDALAAYQAAWALAPGAQSAGVEVWLHLMRAGRTAEASAIAAQVAQGGSTDPWWAYDEGDARFFDAWFAELQRLSR